MIYMEFFIPGIPVSRQSHSHMRGVTFLPKESANYQTRVAACAKEALNGLDAITGTVELHAEFIFPAPNSLKKPQKIELEKFNLIYPKIRQDLDNLAKNLLDGLKGVLVADDKQVVTLKLSKRIGKEPGTHVEIWPTA